MDDGSKLANQEEMDDGLTLNSITPFPKENSVRPLLKNIADLNSFVAQHVLERSYFYNFSKYKIDVNNREVVDIYLQISSKI